MIAIILKTYADEHSSTEALGRGIEVRFIFLEQLAKNINRILASENKEQGEWMINEVPQRIHLLTRI